MELDLRALEGLNIPDITIDPKDEIAIAETLTTEKKEELKDRAIEFVDSYDDFNKEEKEIEVISEANGVINTEKIDNEDDTEVIESTEETPSDEVSIVKGIADWAKSEDIFDFTDDEFEDSTDFLKNKINEIAEKKAEEKDQKRLSEYPEVIQEIVKNYRDGVPLDELVYTESRIIEYGNITENQIKESVDLQKKLVSEYLLNNDSDEEEVKKKLEKYEDSGILEDEALTAQKKLHKYEIKYKENLVQENKRIQETQKIEYEQTIKKIEDTINTIPEIIPGIELTKEAREKLIKGYLRPDKNRKTELMKRIESDPLGQLKIAQFYLQLDGDLEKIKVKAKTQAAQTAKKVATTYKETPGLNKLNFNTIKKAVETAKKQREQKI